MKESPERTEREGDHGSDLTSERPPSSYDSFDCGDDKGGGDRGDDATPPAAGHGESPSPIHDPSRGSVYGGFSEDAADLNVDSDDKGASADDAEAQGTVPPMDVAVIFDEEPPNKRSSMASVAADDMDWAAQENLAQSRREASRSRGFLSQVRSAQIIRCRA